jgi:hypothetical protein
MILARPVILVILTAVAFAASAQDRRSLPQITPTFKGLLVLPVPLGNPLFDGLTETIGQVDGAFQVPIFKGWGLGVGAKMTWFALDERPLQPLLRSGEVRRASFYGKIAYEEYTGDRTFFELHARAGTSLFAFDCMTCHEDRPNALHWGAGASYFVHVTHNLAFGFMLGYERDEYRFRLMDLGLESLPGRRDTEEKRNFQNLVIGMGFSTRFTRNPEGPNW